MKQEYHKLISESYKAYIGSYPSTPTIEYLYSEIDSNKLTEGLLVLREEGLMKAQIFLIDTIANKFVNAKKLGITLK